MTIPPNTVWSPCRDFQCMISWAYDWQTMIAGFVAVAAAVWAGVSAWEQVKTARTQIGLADRQYSRDRQGRLRASRAALPTSLSEICAYAQAAAKSLMHHWPAGQALYPELANDFTGFAIGWINPPVFPSHTVAVLERVIELTDDEPIAERIESILREAQVLGARMDGLDKARQTNLYQLSDAILQTAALYARAESLFDYARRRSDHLDVRDLWERSEAALFLMGVDNDVIKRIGKGHRMAGYAPGEADTPNPQ